MTTGVCMTSFIVTLCTLCNTEYISRGTLKSHIMDMSVELPWHLRVKLAKDVACGMVCRSVLSPRNVCAKG